MCDAEKVSDRWFFSPAASLADRKKTRNDPVATAQNWRTEPRVSTIHRISGIAERCWQNWGSIQHVALRYAGCSKATAGTKPFIGFLQTLSALELAMVSFMASCKTIGFAGGERQTASAVAKFRLRRCDALWI